MPPRSCPSASNESPPHRLGRDRLAHPALHGEGLQVGQAFLQRKPLLVEVLARTPQLERDLPRGLLVTTDYLHDLVEPAPMMRDQRVDPRPGVFKRPAARGKT